MTHTTTKSRKSRKIYDIFNFFQKEKRRQMNCINCRSKLCYDIGWVIHPKYIHSRRSENDPCIFNTIIVSKQPFGATLWLWNIENMTQNIYLMEEKSVVTVCYNNITLWVHFPVINVKHHTFVIRYDKHRMCSFHWNSLQSPSHLPF